MLEEFIQKNPLIPPGVVGVLASMFNEQDAVNTALVIAVWTLLLSIFSLIMDPITIAPVYFALLLRFPI